MSILHRPKLSRPAPAPLAPVALPDTTLGRRLEIARMGSPRLPDAIERALEAREAFGFCKGLLIGGGAGA